MATSWSDRFSSMGEKLKKKLSGVVLLSGPPLPLPLFLRYTRAVTLSLNSGLSVSDVDECVGEWKSLFTAVLKKKNPPWPPELPQTRQVQKSLNTAEGWQRMETEKKQKQGVPVAERSKRFILKENLRLFFIWSIKSQMMQNETTTICWRIMRK